MLYRSLLVPVLTKPLLLLPLSFHSPKVFQGTLGMEDRWWWHFTWLGSGKLDHLCTFAHDQGSVLLDPVCKKSIRQIQSLKCLWLISLKHLHLFGKEKALSDAAHCCWTYSSVNEHVSPLMLLNGSELKCRQSNRGLSVKHRWVISVKSWIAKFSSIFHFI